MSDPTLLNCLIVAVCAAVALLLLVLWTGWSARRTPHFVSVAVFLPVLLLAVYFAESYGRRFRFDPDWLGIHLALAWSAVISLAGPLVSGWLSLRRVRAHPAHRLLAFLFTILAVAAVVTGGILVAYHGVRIQEG